MTAPLHPQARARLQRILESGEPPLETLTPAEARRTADARVRANTLPRFDGPTARDLLIPGPGGELRLRVYRPEGAGEAVTPLVLAFHGGGFMVGDLETHDSLCRTWTARAGVTVAAVEYRLAPEHPFPAAPHDALAATDWALAHAAELRVDASRFALLGESSGGALTAVVAQALAGRGGPQPRLQVMIYPALDMGMDTPSYREFADGYFFTAAKSRYFLEHYMRSPADAEDPLCSPLRAPSVAGVCPALIVTAGLDPLLSEAEQYAERLRGAGVPVEYRCMEGWPHGFLFWGETDAAREVIDVTVARLAAALGAEGRP